MPLLFSYGTLGDPAVQRATFGRELAGRADRLPGFAVTLVEITDPHVLTVSGRRHHPIVRRSDDPDAGVDGVALEVTDAELTAADGYEVDDYERVAVVLASGAAAWVYVSRAAQRAP